MALSDDSPLSRVPAASSALLSAALGGLLCFGTACDAPNSSTDAADARTRESGGADAGSSGADGSRDTGALDAGGSRDTGALDAGGSRDTGALDAGSSVDAAAGSDATREGGLADPDAGCDVVDDRVITDASTTPALTLEVFTEWCRERGGYIEIHPHCGGANTCRGLSYDEGTYALTEHSCAGLNTCAGFSCVTP